MTDSPTWFDLFHAWTPPVYQAIGIIVQGIAIVIGLLWFLLKGDRTPMGSLTFFGALSAAIMGVKLLGAIVYVPSIEGLRSTIPDDGRGWFDVFMPQTTVLDWNLDPMLGIGAVVAIFLGAAKALGLSITKKSEGTSKELPGPPPPPPPGGGALPRVREP